PGPHYTITSSAALGSGLGNYAITYVTGIMHVNVKALTITATSPSKTYGTAVTPAGTEFTTSGLVNSNTVTSVTLASGGYAAIATDREPGPEGNSTGSAARGSGT